MKRFQKKKKNGDFQLVYGEGKSYANRLLVMYVRNTGRSHSRIGISVSKKVGNSVVRHRMARLVRESFRLSENVLRTGLDIVVVVRPAAKNENFRGIEGAFQHLCGLHNIYSENRSEQV